MPRLSDSMESGVIVAWLVPDGGEVSRGTPLVEIETDKATVIYDAPAAGTLRIEVQAGRAAAVGQPLARLEGAAARGAATNGARRVVASPLARRIAAEAGVDLASLPGSGPRGRIVGRDVRAARDSGGSPRPADDATSAGGVGGAGGIESPGALGVADAAPPAGEPLSRVRAVAARRLAEAHAAIPDFALTAEVDAAALTDLRARLKADAGDERVPSVTDFIVKAAGLALREAPGANASYRDGDRVTRHARVNVGIAVDTPDGLLVPTVFDADQRTLGEIARTTRDLAIRARAGQLSPAELDGATFTVSNLGMHGVIRFTAIVNPPQAAILAAGAICDRVVALDGRPAVRPVMELTLCCDHRILDGADGALLLAAISGYLQRPARLLL